MQQKSIDGNNNGCFNINYWTEEKRLSKSLEKIALYEEFPEKHPNRKVANNRTKMTYPEQVAFDWLKNNNIKFEHQFKIEKSYVDFKIDNILIEIDGDYWHPIGNERDKEKDILFHSLGYKVFRIRTSERIIERLEEIFKE